MFIPEKYKLVEGKEPESGSVEVECSICKTKYIVPPDVLKECGTVPVCEGCSDAYEKAQKDLAAAKLNSSSTADKASDIGSSTAAKAASI